MLFWVNRNLFFIEIIKEKKDASFEQRSQVKKKKEKSLLRLNHTLVSMNRVKNIVNIKVILRYDFWLVALYTP